MNTGVTKWYCFSSACHQELMFQYVWACGSLLVAFDTILIFPSDVSSCVFVAVFADKKLKRQVHEIAGRINARFGSLSAVPVHYLVGLHFSLVYAFKHIFLDSEAKFSYFCRIVQSTFIHCVHCMLSLVIFNLKLEMCMLLYLILCFFNC